MRIANFTKPVFVLSFILLSFPAFSQPDVYWDATSVAPAPFGPNYTVSDISQNNNKGTTTFITTTSNSSGDYDFPLNAVTTNASGGGNFGLAAEVGVLNTAPGGSAFVEMTITPEAGYKLNITNVNFASRSTGSGPQAFSIQYSIAGSAFTEAATGAMSNTSTWAYFQNPATISGGLGQAVTIRIYGYSGTGSANNNTANWRLDDIVITTSTSLPVVFGSIYAFQKDNALQVKWTTQSETNNDYFEVQASKDGSVFTTIKTVKSANGNSDNSQDYEVNLTLTDATAMMGVPAALGLLALGLFRRRRQTAVYVVAATVLVVVFVACSRQADSLEVNSIEKIFIRIKQVDKNGVFKYSEVVQVVKK